MDELVKIQTGILKKLRELNVVLGEWDKNYFLKNNHLPTFAHVKQDEDGKTANKKTKICKSHSKRMENGLHFLTPNLINAGLNSAIYIYYCVHVRSSFI